MRLTHKEALTYFPILGLLVAMSYDVGFFYGVGIYYFSFFSLAEHIVFALQFILVVVVITTIVVCSLTVLPLSVFKKLSGLSGGYRIAAVLIVVIVVGVISFYYNWLELWFILSIIIVYVFGYQVLARFDLLNNERVMYPVILLSIATAALCVGILTSGVHLRASNILHEIELKSGSVIFGRLVRGGERGVLLFNVKSEKIEFRKWDDVVKIESRLNILRLPR